MDKYLLNIFKFTAAATIFGFVSMPFFSPWIGVSLAGIDVGFLLIYSMICLGAVVAGAWEVTHGHQTTGGI